jgi:nicotinamidase-related amidase
MKKKLLIVVDMQNDFVGQQGKLSICAKDKDTTEELRVRIANFVRTFDGHVVLTRDTHLGDSCEFSSFPEHCLKDTIGWEVSKEIVEALQGKKEVRNLIEKITGHMEGKTFEYANKASYGSPILETIFVDAGHLNPEIHVVGVCTHICVHDVVSQFVNSTKENFNYIPNITVHKDMIGDFNPEMAEMTLTRLKNLYGVKVCE